MSGANTLLHALIEDSGVSRAGLAARVNTITGRRYDHRSVGRWIRGEHPRDGVPEAIAAALSDVLRVRISLDDIGMSTSDDSPYTELSRFTSQAPTLWRADEPGLPDAALITGLDAIAPIWEWESPAGDFDVSRQGGRVVVGPHHILALQAARTHYERMYRAAGGIPVRPRVRAYLRSNVTDLLQGRYDDWTGRELFRAAAGVVAVAGICAYDSDLQGWAQKYFHQALRMAKAAQDRAFGAYVIALLVNQSLHHSDYKQAVAFAEAALRTGGGHVSPALATDLLAMQAKAFARMRDHGQSHDRMVLTEAAEGLIRREEEPPETGYVQPGLVQTQFAEALLSLGDLRGAHECADAAVATATHARGQVNRLTTSIRIALAGDQLDLAAEKADLMLDLGAGMESSRLAERFRAIRRDMATKHGCSALSSAVERLDAALSIPAV